LLLVPERHKSETEHLHCSVLIRGTLLLPIDLAPLFVMCLVLLPSNSRGVSKMFTATK